jgi:hypothetical protein
LLDHFRAAGIALAALPDGRIRATGPLTDALRATIREQKPAILAELAAANDSVSPAVAAELHELVAIVGADWLEAERAEALAVAIADPDSALACFRALAAEHDNGRTSATPDDGMRPCVTCANLTAKGQCLAVARGEPLGWGVTAARVYFPIWTDRPHRCAGYLPRPDDADRRTGKERWPFLLDDQERM